MTESVQIALIVAVPPTLVAVAALVSSLKNSSKLQALHIDLNSRLTQLMEASAKSERAMGHAAGLEEGRQTSLNERQDRVNEAERVEDRSAQIADGKK